MNAPAVCQDLKENHHRKIAHSYLQDVSDWVGSIAQAKEEVWDYATPKLNEAMVGNISLYDVTGKRQHTVYLGEAPEYGKGPFLHRLKKEIRSIKKQYPDALYLGIADGAKNNWTFLEKHTRRQLLDYFHVTEYLATVSYAAYPGKTGKPKREI